MDNPPEETQKEYEKALTEYREDRDKHKDPKYRSYNLDHLWKQALREIFKGAIPGLQDIDELMADPLLARRDRSFPTTLIWSAMRSVLSSSATSARLAVTPHTERLASMAVAGYPGASSTSSLMDEDNRYNWEETNITAIATFRQHFPAHASKLLRRATEQKMYFSTPFLMAFKDSLDTDDLKKIIPEHPEALALIVQMLGPELSDEYYAMANGIKERASTGWHSPWSTRQHPVKTLLETLPEPYLTYTRSEANKMFSTGNEDYSKAIAECQKATAPMLDKALRYLSGLVNQPHISLGIPYAMPEKLSGKALCKMLVFLEQCVQNPAHMISGLPDPQDFATKAIELQFASDKDDIELHANALEALDRLVSKISGETTSCGSILKHLRNIVAKKDEELLYNRLRHNYHASAADVLLMFSCIFDLQRQLEKNPANFMDVAYDDMQWSRKPTEQEAFSILSFLKESWIEDENNNQQETA